MVEMKDEVLKVREAAKFLKVTGKRITQLASAGEIPGRCIEGEWRFSKNALLGWLSRKEDRAMPVFEVILPEDSRRKIFPPRPTHPKLAAEHDTFERMLPDLMKQYEGKYIALREGVVIAVGASEIDALTTANEKYPGELIFVRLVTDQPQPIPRIGAPRVVRRGE